MCVQKGYYKSLVLPWLGLGAKLDHIILMEIVVPVNPQGLAEEGKYRIPIQRLCCKTRAARSGDCRIANQIQTAVFAKQSINT